MVSLLLARGADIRKARKHIRDENCTVLMAVAASYHGHHGIVESVLARGAADNWDERDENG